MTNPTKDPGVPTEGRREWNQRGRSIPAGAGHGPAEVAAERGWDLYQLDGFWYVNRSKGARREPSNQAKAPPEQELGAGISPEDALEAAIEADAKASAPTPPSPTPSPTPSTPTPSTPSPRPPFPPAPSTPSGR